MSAAGMRDPDGLVRRALGRPLPSAGLAFLLLLAGLIGVATATAPDAYRQLHPDHVLAPPSLAALPAPEEADAAIAEAALTSGTGVAVLSRTDSTRTLSLCGPASARSQFAATLRASGQAGHVEVDAANADGCARASVGVRRLRFPFGTDDLGRDMFSRTLIGVGVSLVVGLVTALAATVIGVGYGTAAGFFGGWADFLLMRVVDATYALPFLFVVILLAAVLGGGVWLTILVLAGLEWPDTARIIRGRTISIMQEDYAQAAAALGVARHRILLRHILPNTFELAGVQAAVLLPKLITLETTLSFLGFGVREPTTSAGLLIFQGTGNLEGAPWLALFPAALLIVSLLALGVVGDSLRAEVDATP